jgi:hypothetical protein
MRRRCSSSLLHWPQLSRWRRPPAPPSTSRQMNEPAGATIMLDSSGNGMNGTIGAHVQASTALSGGGTGYRFPYLRPNTPPADPPRMWCGWPMTHG